MSNAKAILGLLGGEKRREMAETIEAMRKHRVSGFTGQWCAQSRFAVVAMLDSGGDAQWLVFGPADREAARHWLGMQETALAPAANDRSH
jgi:hypothetical protein